MGQNKTKKSIKERRAENRNRKRESLLRNEGRLVDGVEIPRGSLAGDPSKQNHGGGYSAHYFYKDIEYKCADWGKEGIWTAQQQKKYFEEQSGNIYNQPKWCYDCHRARMEEK